LVTMDEAEKESISEFREWIEQERKRGLELLKQLKPGGPPDDPFDLAAWLDDIAL